MKHVVILGGGISGCAAAWHLSKRCDVTLLEKEGRLGGRIETIAVDGALLEKGPRTFSSSRSPRLLALIRNVGLEQEILFSSKQATKRFLWHRGKLRSIGSLLLPSLGRILLEPFAKSAPEQEETIFEFAERRFGRRVAELFFDSMTTGIFAGDAKRLSLSCCLPRLAEWEKEFGSLLIALFRRKRSPERFPGPLFTLKKGMEQIVEPLVRDVDVQLNTAVRDVCWEGCWKIATSKKTFESDHLFCALPAPAAAALWPDMPAIPHASITVVNLLFHTGPFPHRGYGYLVPSGERGSLLGMIWDSEVFPGPAIRLTAMVRADEADPAAVVRDALQRHLRWHGEPSWMKIQRVEGAIPQFFPGHRQRIESWLRELKLMYPTLSISGNYISGVSVEHCIETAEKAVQEMIQNWD